MKQQPAYVFDAPMGGEAWQFQPGQMPWDRPPQHAALDHALDTVFRQLRRPALTKKFLNIMQAGIPIDLIVEGIIMQGFMKGDYGAPIVMQMVPPVTVMMWRMAEHAGIRPMTSADKEDVGMNIDPSAMLAYEKTVSPGQLGRATHANNISVKELSKTGLADKQGFMKFRPKPKVK